MQFTGRIIGNAEVKTLKDDRKLVSFTVAINDSYKRKGNDVAIKTALFINCAYWLNTTIATHLTKGAIVEVEGRLRVTAYTTGDEAKASLNFHINNIKIHHSKLVNEEVKAAQQEQPTVPKENDDLPF